MLDTMASQYTTVYHCKDGHSYVYLGRKKLYKYNISYRKSAGGTAVSGATLISNINSFVPNINFTDCDLFEDSDFCYETYDKYKPSFYYDFSKFIEHNACLSHEYTRVNFAEYNSCWNPVFIGKNNWKCFRGAASSFTVPPRFYSSCSKSPFYTTSKVFAEEDVYLCIDKLQKKYWSLGANWSPYDKLGGVRNLASPLLVDECITIDEIPEISFCTSTSSFDEGLVRFIAKEDVLFNDITKRNEIDILDDVENVLGDPDKLLVTSTCSPKTGCEKLSNFYSVEDTSSPVKRWASLQKRALPIINVSNPTEIVNVRLIDFSHYLPVHLDEPTVSHIIGINKNRGRVETANKITDVLNDDYLIEPSSYVHQFLYRQHAIENNKPIENLGDFPLFMITVNSEVVYKSNITYNNLIKRVLGKSKMFNYIEDLTTLDNLFTSFQRYFIEDANKFLYRNGYRVVRFYGEDDEAL